jgi:roadblock/LC7 domain-containing protein
MATGWPMKTTYADGDVYSASDVNDTNGTINLLTSSTLSIAAGKNGIINGGFDIWQRGTANVTTANAFTADRWQKNSATHYGISRVAVGDTTNLPQIQYAARIQRTNASATTTVCALVYSMETNDAMKFAGQTVTVSFYARKGANYSGGNFSVIIYTGTGTDQNLVTGYTGGAAQVTASAALTTSMARYTATVTLPATATEIGLYCAFTPTGTAGANDYVDMTGVQLPTVPVATGDFAFAQCFSTSKALVTIPYFVQPRVAPTGVTVSAAASFALRTATAGFTFATTVAFNNATLNSANLEVTAGVALIAGNASTFYNSAGSLLFTGCEL